MTRFLLLAFVACSTSTDVNHDLDGIRQSDVERAPRDVHPGWFKSPEVIQETVIRTWGLTLSAEEKLTYIDGFRALLGGVIVGNHGAVMQRPHEMFSLIIASFSDLLAQRLVDKQEITYPYMFDGLGMAPPDDGCYADDTKDWCDVQDNLNIGDVSNWNLTSLTKEQRKRLMHKMQAIGEFFLMAIDELIVMPAGNRHAPAFLVDEVFLPKLGENPSYQQEKLAWREVVVTILMSGYFFDLPAEQ